MSQSAVLVATLAAAFVLFLAARGRLGVYGQALFGPKPQASSGGTGGSGGSTSDTISQIGQAVGTAAKVAAFVAV